MADGKRNLQKSVPVGIVAGTRSHDAVIRINDEAGNVIETYEQAGDFKES